MHDILSSSLALAAQKVRFFPLVSNSKIPAVGKFSDVATSDPMQIEKMFANGAYNSGIACGKVAENLYLVGLDIDNKDGRNGYLILEELQMYDFEFPETWSQITPSGGEHRLFWSPVSIRQGADVLGAKGFDLRGEGGYLVGPGSSLDGIPYKVLKNLPIAQFPQWAIDKYAKKDAPVINIKKKTAGQPINQVMALKSSVEYLSALSATSAGSRNDAGYKVACKLKDFGLERAQVPDVMLRFWKCEPMLDDSELEAIANSAFNYSKNEIGILSPEKVFDIIPTDAAAPDFIEEFNKRFFYCAANGTSRVCELITIDYKETLERYAVATFHEKLLSETLKEVQDDKIKISQRSKEWMRSRRRRSYDAIRFIPRDTVSPKVYNLWRGFHVKPADAAKVYSAEGRDGAAKFIKHCQENICDNDAASFKWLMSFTAHLFQKPWEKPPVAVVFQGLKGTGKNIFIDCLKHMIGKHSVTVSGKHALTSNFNSLMEDKILIALDEAFWSGDKSVEGILKSMITDSLRNIERKGEEPYQTQVYDRIFIMGNEDRLVNATGDERRFAVFNIADYKRGDIEFFGSMMKGLIEHNGCELLMEYFLNFDISTFNIRKAPDTKGLRDQKEQSLTDLQRFWFECLQEGRITNNFEGVSTWPEKISSRNLHETFYRFSDEHGSKYRLTSAAFNKQFEKIAPSCAERKKLRIDGQSIQGYTFCELKQARLEWERSMGMKEKWE